MKKGIRIMYWSGLHNVTFVHNCYGSMLVEMNLLVRARANLTNIYVTNFRPAVNSTGPAHRKTVYKCCQKLPVTGGINNF